MGCHTWFYKKTEITDVEVLENAIKRCKDDIIFYDRVVNDREELSLEYSFSTWELYVKLPELTVEFGKKYRKKSKAKLSRILKLEKPTSKMYEDYRDCNDSIFEYIKGKGFYVSGNEMPHDLFRIGNFPDTKLFSLDETFEFMYKNKNKISGIDDSTIKLLEKFWMEYPDGMIQFG